MIHQQTTQASRFALLIRKSPIFVFLALLTVQLAVVSAAPAAQGDAPKAVIDVTTHEFGEAFAGEELEYSFTVRNAGTKPLELAEKSTIPSRSAGQLRAPSPAIWQAGDRVFARASAFTRAAPS